MTAGETRKDLAADHRVRLDRLFDGLRNGVA
jgi:hypothetical protein